MKHNPVRPNSDLAVKKGPECEVNAVNEDEEIPDDNDEMIMKVLDEEDGVDETDKKVEEEEAPPPAMEERGEAVQTRPLRRPGQPSKKQIREHHQASHLPFRSWCKFCVEGRGRHDHHRSGQEVDKFDKQIPCVSLDYCFMGDDRVDAKECPILVSFDNNTGSVNAYAVKRKGVVMWLPKAIGLDLEFMGYNGCRINLKTDQEKSIMAVKRSVAEWRGAPTSMIESPMHDSQSNGKMERAVQNFQGHLRTLKLALGNSIGVKVGVKSRIFAWLCTWACTSLNRYRVGADGLTAFQRATGTQCSRPIAEFGEQILWKRPTKIHQNKAETLWEEGTFLGLKGRTSEVLVADRDGHVRRCRTIRARPDEERWSAERVQNIRDTVAQGLYDFNREDDNESEAENDTGQENEDKPEEDEDAVADLFGPTDDEAEADETVEKMSEGSYDSVGSPERMNLVSSIKELENILSSQRIEESKKIMALIMNGNDVTEIFSPPRIAEAAKDLGLLPGASMDIRTGWDFSKPADRRRAVEYIKEQKPYVVMGSPPCKLFSILQGLNKHVNGEEWTKKFMQRKQEAVEHLEFCVAIYRLQAASGRYWVHEHPNSATSWHEACIRKMVQMPGVIRVRADQCMYGLKTQVKDEIRRAMKPTGFMTNSWCVAKRLTRRCDGSHPHFSLMEGRASAAEVYPKLLCQEICRGILDQKEYDRKGTACTKSLNSVELSKILKEAGWPPHWRDVRHGDTKEEKDLEKEIYMLGVKNGTAWAYDDVTYAALPADLVKRARMEEIEYVRKMGVYTMVPRSEAAGKKVIKLRWIDVNKMDAQNPLIRSRVVAKEFNDGVDPDLFAATPPIEALRYLISNAATVGGEKKCLMINDVSRAFFNAKVTREVYVQLPAEDILPGEEGMVGRLNLCFYGTRDAAMQWQERVAEHLTSIGFQRSAAFPSLYYHPDKQLCTLVHGDDYVTSGSRKMLKWLQSELESVFEIKTDVLGHNEEGVKGEGKVLNRLIKAEENAWTLEADPRHAELLIEDLSIEAGLATPGVDEKDDEEDKELSEADSTRYRSLVARANYLATDRPDISFPVKELCRSMSRPTASSWKKMIRVVKYLHRNPRLVLRYGMQEAAEELDVFSDANWAGCKATRRSTSGGVIMRGKHLIKSWSKTQNAVSLSSAESEFHATLKAATEGLGLITMASAFGDVYKVRLHVDASAALGVIQRKGVGKIRHLHAGSLWLQEQQVRNSIAFAKVKGTENPSDLFTKYLSREMIDKHLKVMQAEKSEGRSSKAAQLHQLQKKVRQLKAQVRNKEVHAVRKVEDEPRYAEEEWTIGMVREYAHKVETKNDSLVEGGYQEWKHGQCKQLGRSRSLKRCVNAQLRY